MSWKTVAVRRVRMRLLPAPSKTVRSCMREASYCPKAVVERTSTELVAVDLVECLSETSYYCGDNRRLRDAGWYGGCNKHSTRRNQATGMSLGVGKRLVIARTSIVVVISHVIESGGMVSTHVPHSSALMHLMATRTTSHTTLATFPVVTS